MPSCGWAGRQRPCGAALSFPKYVTMAAGKVAVSAELATSKSNAVTSYSGQKVTSYLIRYFLKIVTSYFTSYYKK